MHVAGPVHLLKRKYSTSAYRLISLYIFVKKTIESIGNFKMDRAYTHQRPFSKSRVIVV